LGYINFVGATPILALTKTKDKKMKHAYVITKDGKFWNGAEYTPDKMNLCIYLSAVSVVEANEIAKGQTEKVVSKLTQLPMLLTKTIYI
jgi:hypothetical protein